MLVTVGKSSDITHSLTYARNKEKDGSILSANYTDISVSPEQQAKDWEAISNDYRVKCYTMVVSFSNEETEFLRAMSDKGQEKVRTLIDQFLSELSDKGNDVSDCPYIVARHDNTDNEHYHICILATDIFGRRLNDSFIGKNATRAAAKIAMDNSLPGAKKAMEREKAHQEAVGKRKKDKHTRHHSPSVSQEKIDDKLRRKKAVEESKKRKASLAFIINHVAQQSNKDNFLDNLAKEGIKLQYNEKKGLVADMIDKNGKPRTYSLMKDLGIDLAILPALPPLPVKQDAVSPKVKHQPTPSPSTKSPVLSHVTRSMNSGGGGSVNREWEVGSKKRNPDDPDEEVKRKGMSY